MTFSLDDISLLSWKKGVSVFSISSMQAKTFLSLHLLLQIDLLVPIIPGRGSH